APSTSTTVMSFASDTRLSATDEPTWPAPRMTIFNPEVRAKKHAFYAESPGPPNPPLLVLSPSQDPERLQLSVQMRSFETAALGQARDGSVRLGKMMLEVGPLERLSRLAQREVKGDLRLGRAPGELRQNALRVAHSYLLLQAGERERAHCGSQVLEVAGPGEIAQNVQRAGREDPRRAEARLHQLGEHQRSDLGNVFRVLAQGGKGDDDSRERLHQRRGEPLPIHEALGLIGRHRDPAD